MVDICDHQQRVKNLQLKIKGSPKISCQTRQNVPTILPAIAYPNVLESGGKSKAGAESGGRPPLEETPAGSDPVPGSGGSTEERIVDDPPKPVVEVDRERPL